MYNVSVSYGNCYVNFEGLITQSKTRLHYQEQQTYQNAVSDIGKLV